MKTTEKKYWVNGHQLRGGWFHTVNISVRSLVVMVSWGTLPNGYRHDSLKIKFYKLV